MQRNAKHQPEKAKAITDQFQALLKERCSLRAFDEHSTNSYMIGYLLATIEQHLAWNSSLRTDMKRHLEWVANYNEEIKTEIEGEQV
jgi:hypothetical protein